MVYVDPYKLASRGLSVMDVVDAVNKNNRIRPVGDVKVGNPTITTSTPTCWWMQSGFRTIGVGAWLGTIMLFNVWVFIWPNQKKILGIVPATDEEKAAARKTAGMASRINFILSVAHADVYGWPGAWIAVLADHVRDCCRRGLGTSSALGGAISTHELVQSLHHLIG